MASKIGGIVPPEEGGEKKKVSPNQRKFQEMMKIEKPGEVEFEQPKKKLSSEHEEDNQEEVSPSPYDVSYTKPSDLSTSQKKEVLKEEKETIVSSLKKPISPEKKIKPALAKEKVKLSSKKKALPQEEEKKPSFTVEEKKEVLLQTSTTPDEKEQKVLRAKASLEEKKQRFLPTEEVETKVPLEEEKEFLPAKEVEIKAPIKPKKGVLPAKEVETKDPSVKKEKTAPSKSRKVKEELPLYPPVSVSSATLQEMAATKSVSSTLSPELSALFEKMVGSVTVMTKQDISETMVTLNSPDFQNSAFFGTKILFLRYATAPDSFNIVLMAESDLAMNLFNQDNLASLLTAFQKQNLNFRIGNISAEYDPSRRPLFRRKEKNQENQNQDSET